MCVVSSLNSGEENIVPIIQSCVPVVFSWLTNNHMHVKVEQIRMALLIYIYTNYYHFCVKKNFMRPAAPGSLCMCTCGFGVLRVLRSMSLWSYMKYVWT